MADAFAVKNASLQGQLSDLVAGWRKEDLTARAGRPSWGSTGKARLKPGDKASIRAAYDRGEPVASILYTFSIRPGTLYKIVTPKRDTTGRMGGVKTLRKPRADASVR